MISVRFQGSPLNNTVIQVYAPTSNAEETEVQWFYEDLRDFLELLLMLLSLFLELTPPKMSFYIIVDWNAKVGSQEIPGVTGKFGLRVTNKAGQRLTEFPSELNGHSRNPYATTQEKTLHMVITRGRVLESN